MNTSPSPKISTFDPLRAPLEVTGAQSPRAPSGGSDNSFDAVYQDESASLDNEKPNISINNNKLEPYPEEGNIALRNPQDEANNADEQMHSLLPGKQEYAAAGDKEAITASPELDPNSDGPSFEAELVHGISIALPSAAGQAKAGEMLPPSGKELPQDGELTEQYLPLRGPMDELGRQSPVVRNDHAFQLSEKYEDLQAGDRLKFIGQNLTRSEPSFGELNLETILAKTTSDLQIDGISQAPARGQAEPATANSIATISNSSIAVTSPADAGVLQKLTAIAESTSSADINASARANSFDWSTALGDKVHWMRNAKVSTAELHLHPAELGSIEIKIVTEDQQTRVSFITSSASARDIIEESMPKLRDLLADSGLELDQSDISHKESGEQTSKEQQNALVDSKSIEGELSGEMPVTRFSSRAGQIDHYV